MASTILVIDDDPSIVHLLKEDLEQEGYKVLEGYDGQAALQMAKAAKPNLIILDINMPLINGLKALEYLRDLAETKNIPILFLSGEASSRLAPALSQASRVAHVKKPIDLDDLNSLVHTLLEKYPT
jgi:two-component system, chemotaxis family, chemotaxis protein CheY